MTRVAWLLALSLAAPVGGQDKKAVPTPEDLAREAEAQVVRGELDLAVETLRRATALPAASGEIWLQLGRLLDSRLELDGAIAAYQSAADKLAAAKKGEALGRMAVAQEVRGMAQSAPSAEAALAADPAGPWPLAAVARIRAREGKGDEAVGLAEKARGAGGGAVAEAVLGYAHEARGDVAAAESAYRAALAAEANNPIAAIGLARVLRKTSRAAEAEPMIQAILAKAPGAIAAYKELARIKLAMGRPAEAVGDAATAAAMSENDPDAQALVDEVAIAKALAQVAAGQIDLAVQDLMLARDRQPGSAAVRLGLAKALIARRNADEAIVELQKAVEIDPKNAEAYFQLGHATHMMKRNPAGAVSPLQQAAAAEPSNSDYRTALGAALYDSKQYDRAIEELTKATAAPGYKRADGWIYLGASQLALKRYKDALPALEKGAAAAPQSADAAAYLAWSYFGLKDADNFKKQAARAKSLGHKEPTLLDYLKRIEAGEPIK